MSRLVDLAISAHGGMDRRKRLSTVSAHLRVGGALWALTRKEGFMGDVNFEAELHRERASFGPFQSPDGRTAFTPDRVAIETTGGAGLDERHDPYSSFAAHVRDTPWDNLHAVYSGSYALWTYLTIPFLFTYPGLVTKEMPTWREDGQIWRRLRVHFPASIATHSTEQVFFTALKCARRLPPLRRAPALARHGRRPRRGSRDTGRGRGVARAGRTSAALGRVDGHQPRRDQRLSAIRAPRMPRPVRSGPERSCIPVNQLLTPPRIPLTGLLSALYLGEQETRADALGESLYVSYALHGGMGMTDELSVGYYFKRLTMIDMTFGNVDWHLKRFAAL